MARARAALLVALALVASGSPFSPLSKVARRMSEDALPPSCFAACPCLVQMMQEMGPPHDEDDNSHDGVDHDDHDGHDHGGDGDDAEGRDKDEHEGTGYAIFHEQMEAICQWKGGFQCIKEHPDECGGADNDILEWSDSTSCLCDACPSAVTLPEELALVWVSALADAFGDFPGGEPAGGQQSGGEIEMMCRLKSSIECLESTPECAAMAAEMTFQPPSTPQRKLSSTMDNWMMGNWSINSTNWPWDMWPMDNWSTWNLTGGNWSWPTWNWTGGNWSTWNWPMDNWSFPNGSGINFNIDVLSILDNLTCPKPDGTTQPPAPEVEQATCPPYSAGLSGHGSTTGAAISGTDAEGSGDGSTTGAADPDEMISGALGGRSPPRLALAPLLALLAALSK